MSAPPFTFGISEFTTWPWSFEQDVQRYARLGVQAIEVCEFKLGTGSLERDLALIDRHGLRMSSVQPVIRTLYPSVSMPEPKGIAERMESFRDTIRRFGDHASGVPFVTNTGIAPDGNMQEVLDTAARRYRELADFAAGSGARVAIEPLNATIMNVESTIWTLQQGMRIVDAVDRPNFGICLDSWNIWQSPDILQAIRDCGDRIFLVQISDWRTPRSYLDRLIPGQGDIPLAAMLRAIHEAGYRGPYVVEIFSGDIPDSLWKSDLEAVIAASREGVEQAWSEAFSA